MRERHVRDVIDVVLRRSGWVRGVRRAEAVLAWPRIVGHEVARFATAVAFQNGSLVVEVSDAETAMHLGFQRQHILDAYRARLGNETVREVRFRVGRMPVAAPPPAEPSPEPDLGEVAAITSTLDPLPDDLAAAAKAAARSLSVLRARRRAAGWRPCTICGTLTEPDHLGTGHPPGRGDAGPRCGTCRRQADLPKVRTAAERLATAPGAPTPALTEDEREVARALAEARAHARIADLLPRALAEPRLAADLDVAVRCAVALHRGVDLAAVPDLDDVDPARDGVDTRALRALGRIRPRNPEVPPT
jgi:hypothetical protein